MQNVIIYSKKTAFYMLPYTIGKFSEAVIRKRVRITERISAIVNADGDRKT